MLDRRENSFMKTVLKKLERLVRKEPEPPEDPYSYVTAPTKPKPPHLSARAAADLDD